MARARDIGRRMKVRHKYAQDYANHGDGRDVEAAARPGPGPRSEAIRRKGCLGRRESGDAGNRRDRTDSSATRKHSPGGCHVVHEQPWIMRRVQREPNPEGQGVARDSRWVGRAVGITRRREEGYFLLQIPWRGDGRNAYRPFGCPARRNRPAISLPHSPSGSFKATWTRFYIVHADYQSVLSSPPIARKLLPVYVPEEGPKAGAYYILDPSAKEILARILPLYLTNVYLSRPGGKCCRRAGRSANGNEGRDRQR